MKNIHVLPTDKPSRLFINPLWEHQLRFVKDKLIEKKHKERLPHNIYITSDEKIKEGDYYLPFSKSIVKKTTKYGEIGKSKTSMDFSLDYLKKIILTTDQDLIKDGVQAIDDEFLEWFVKNPSCEEVYISVVKTRPRGSNGEWEVNYGINIQKEELSTKLHIGEAKQETLEEAASKVLYNKYPYYPPQDSGYWKDMFKEGAKWQSERMYSEEEVHKILGSYSANKEVFSHKYTYDMWFEQFKKK